MRRRVINLINDRFARPDEDARAGARADNAYERRMTSPAETSYSSCTDAREAEGSRESTRMYIHAMRRTRSRVEGIARDKWKRGIDAEVNECSEKRGRSVVLRL